MAVAQPARKGGAADRASRRVDARSFAASSARKRGRAGVVPGRNQRIWGLAPGDLYSVELTELEIDGPSQRVQRMDDEAMGIRELGHVLRDHVIAEWLTRSYS